MNNTLVINVDIGETRVALIEEGVLGELYLEREQDRRAALRSIRNANYDAITERTTAKRARTVGSSFGGAGLGGGSFGAPASGTAE